MSYLMLDLLSLDVSEAESEMLRHPQVGGLILFSRNFSSRDQLIRLVQQIRQIRPELLIAVDHEGVEYNASAMALPLFPLWATFYPQQRAI